MISDKGDPLRSPLTPLKKGGIIGKAGIFKCGNHLSIFTFLDNEPLFFVYCDNSL
ncbi:hypothetical protein CWATWH0401_4579 [Crocosphaera watsonii WH 0401]|uniref:Uncharacterized protein n=1 Tax=Crocosphaera watsonii WH 0401 TaxID=555881 RepID=T2J341_CROWT|nr:hypothetical protein CWATWH0401_4579 [Crocosphaera watsonii WH 0401]